VQLSTARASLSSFGSFVLRACSGLLLCCPKDVNLPGSAAVSSPTCVIPPETGSMLLLGANGLLCLPSMQVLLPCPTDKELVFFPCCQFDPVWVVVSYHPHRGHVSLLLLGLVNFAWSVAAADFSLGSAQFCIPGNVVHLLSEMQLSFLEEFCCFWSCLLIGPVSRSHFESGVAGPL
jgi:hypothetical protein